MYCTALLLCPAHRYTPPIFGQSYYIGLFYLHYMPSPPLCPGSRSQKGGVTAGAVRYY